MKLTASNWVKNDSGFFSIFSVSTFTSTMGLRFCARSKEASALFRPTDPVRIRNWAPGSSGDTWEWIFFFEYLNLAEHNKWTFPFYFFNSLMNLLQLQCSLFYVLVFRLTACEILASGPRTELTALESKVITTGPPGTFPWTLPF